MPLLRAAVDGGEGDVVSDGHAEPLWSGAPKRGDAARARLLVADDDPDMLEYLALVLGDEFAVVTVDDGERAWDAARRQRFDVVVTDVMMHALGGVELTMRIKASTTLKHLPVILLTACGGADAVARSLDAGADDYVVKPVAEAELRARVRAAVRMGRLQRELQQRAREAGMAQVAAGCLHDIGNALTGVSVSMGLLRDVVEGAPVELLAELARRLGREGAQREALAAYLASDPRGEKLARSLAVVAEQLVADRAQERAELEALREHIEHIAAIVRSQQRLAHAREELVLVELAPLVERAVLLSGASSDDDGVRIERHLGDLPALAADPCRLTQILVNLVQNARQALAGSQAAAPLVTIRTYLNDAASVVIEITDNGVGIARDDLARIFAQGFTTKGSGHGLGLHFSALATKEMGGTLAAHSDGPGTGATFTVTLPLREASCA